MKQFAILIISSFLLTGNILSQVWYNAEPDEHRLVYWFHVRVKIIEDDSTGYVSYVITEVQNKLSHGNLIEYQTDLFKSLKNNILPIGPFYDFHEAWKSKIIYEHAVLNSITDSGLLMTPKASASEAAAWLNFVSCMDENDTMSTKKVSSRLIMSP